MSDYQRIRVSTGENVGDPGPLPDAIAGWTDPFQLADVAANVASCPVDLLDAGFVLIVPPPPAPTVSAYVNKFYFQARFTQAELVMFNRTRRKIGTLTDVAYDAAKGTPAWLLVQFEAFLLTYDAAENINLLDPTTEQGLELFAALGIIAPARISVILDPTVITPPA